MVRILLIIFLFFGVLDAEDSSYREEGSGLTPLQSKIQNFIGKSKFNANREYINILFTPTSQYIKSNHIESVKVMKTLVQNQLLTLKLPYKRFLKIDMITEQAPALFVKLMKDSLRNLGYYRYKTLESSYNGKEFVWSIGFNTKYIPNISKIAEQLHKVGAHVIDVERVKENEWSYKVDISHSVVESLKIQSMQNVTLRHSLYAYWVDIKSVQSVMIKSARRNSWYPSIAIFDKNLKLLKVIKQDKKTDSLLVQLPENGVYMSISDMYNMKNIKETLSLYPKGGK